MPLGSPPHRCVSQPFTARFPPAPTQLRSRQSPAAGRADAAHKPREAVERSHISAHPAN